MAIKLDMSKVYDRVKRKFLTTVMKKLGFHNRWIDLIMHCITTISYFVLLNDKSQISFKSTRGIRQGDALSPYLFIICDETLSHLLSKLNRIESLLVCQLKGDKFRSITYSLLMIVFYFIRLIPLNCEVYFILLSNMNRPQVKH